MQIPRSITKAYLAASALLSFLGVASIVDSLARWRGFFRDVLDVYIYYVRDSIALVFDAIRPSFLPAIPDFLIDALVVWSACYSVLRTFFMLESDHRRLVESQLYGRPLYHLAVFALGPLAPIFLISFQKGRIDSERDFANSDGRDPAGLSEEGILAIRKRLEAVDWWQTGLVSASYSLAYYYSGAILLILVLAFINYQLLLL